MLGSGKVSGNRKSWPRSNKRGTRSGCSRAVVQGTCACGSSYITLCGGFGAFVTMVEATGRSSNGRTADSGSAYRGSNPCLPANSFKSSIDSALLFVATSVQFGRSAVTNPTWTISSNPQSRHPGKECLKPHPAYETANLCTPSVRPAAERGRPRKNEPLINSSRSHDVAIEIEPQGGGSGSDRAGGCHLADARYTGELLFERPATEDAMVSGLVPGSWAET
jgi:hypothetical protein